MIRHRPGSSPNHRKSPFDKGTEHTPSLSINRPSCGVFVAVIREDIRCIIRHEIRCAPSQQRRLGSRVLPTFKASRGVRPVQGRMRRPRRCDGRAITLLRSPLFHHIGLGPAAVPDVPNTVGYLPVDPMHLTPTPIEL